MAESTEYVMVKDTLTGDLSMLLKRGFFEFPKDTSVDRPHVYDVASIMKANGLQSTNGGDQEDSSSEEEEPAKPTAKKSKPTAGIKKQTKTTQSMPKLITLNNKKQKK